MDILYIVSEKEFEETIERAITELQKADSGEEKRVVVARMVSSLRAVQAVNRRVFEQLSALSTYIINAKKEIAAIRPDSIGDEFIPTATDELDAVVSSTEEATHKIMDCCDAISAIAATQAKDVEEGLTGEVTRIYEACNFQDLTGQRITKVVRTLKHIENQVDLLLSALEAAKLHSEERTAGEGKTLRTPEAEDPHKHLLHGPQGPAEAIKQDEIDKLFG